MNIIVTLIPLWQCQENQRNSKLLSKSIIYCRDVVWDYIGLYKWSGRLVYLYIKKEYKEALTFNYVLVFHSKFSKFKPSMSPILTMTMFLVLFRFQLNHNLTAPHESHNNKSFVDISVNSRLMWQKCSELILFKQKHGQQSLLHFIPSK